MACKKIACCSIDDIANIQVIRPGMEPPPSTVGYSCIYVLRRPDGYFYVGETDELKRVSLFRLSDCSIKETTNLLQLYFYQIFLSMDASKSYAQDRCCQAITSTILKFSYCLKQ